MEDSGIGTQQSFREFRICSSDEDLAFENIEDLLKIRFVQNPSPNVARAERRSLRALF